MGERTLGTLRLRAWSAAAERPVEQEAGASTDCAHVQGEPARLSWARLLKRVFDVDIEP